MRSLFGSDRLLGLESPAPGGDRTLNRIPSVAAQRDRTAGDGERRSRGRRTRRRAVVLVPLVLVAGGLISLQTPVAAWIVEPILATQTGMEVRTGSVRVSPLGTVFITDARLRAPEAAGVDGVAGQVLRVDRITARIDWTRTLAGQPGLKSLVLVGPELRLSQDTQTGVLNAASFKLLGGSGGGPTPNIRIQRGTIELGEHTGPDYSMLRRWSVAGTVDVADDDGVSAFSFAAVPAEATAGAGSGSGSLGLDGTIGRDGVTADLNGLTLQDWPASIMPSRLRVNYARLDLSGRLLPTRFTIDPDGRVTVRLTLDGVDLNLPFNEEYSLEGGGELLRMRRTRGTIEFGTEGLAADLYGLIDELRYDVKLRYKGLTADAPFVTELATRFRMDDRFRPRRFLPEAAIEKLEMFEGPTADVSAVVRVAREQAGGPISVAGTADFSDGGASYGKFLYPFHDLRGRVRFTQNSLVIERVEGLGPSGATLLATGEFDGLGEDSAVVIRLEVRGVPLDAHLMAALSTGRRELVEALFDPSRYAELLADGLIRTPDGRGGADAPVFSFGGSADVDLELRRIPERPEDNRWTRQTVVRLDRAGLVPQHFPLPIVARGIELRITDDELSLSGGRYEGLTGGEARVTAAIDQDLVRPGQDPLPIVEIFATGIPVDQRLLAAIPGYRTGATGPGTVSLRSILDNLRVAGMVECRAVIGPRSDGELGYDVEANLYDASARPNAPIPGLSPAPTSETDPLVLAGMTGTVYITERLIVVDLSGVLQSPERPLAPTPITLLTQLTLPERRGGLGDVARVGGLLPIQQGPPVPGPLVYASTRADGLDLAMPLEHAAAVVSPDLALRLAELRGQRRPDGVVALRAEIDGIVGGHTETVLGVDRIRSLSFDHQGVRYEIGQSRGAMELTLGVSPSARFSGFRVPVAAGSTPASELSLDGTLPLLRVGEGAWSGRGEPPSVQAGLRGGRVESPATHQIVAAFAGPGVGAWLSERRVSGLFDLDLRLTPVPDAPTPVPIPAELAEAAGMSGGVSYAIPALSAVGSLRPRTLALDLPESRLAFDAVRGRVVFEGLGGRVDGLTADAPGLSIAADGPWTFTPGRGAGLDWAVTVGGSSLNGSVRAVLPGVLLGVMDRFEVAIEGPVRAEDLRITGEGLGTVQSRLRLSGRATVADARAVIGVPITELQGVVGFEAAVSPAGVGYRVELDADRLRAGRLRVENAQAVMLASDDQPGAVLVPEISGRLHGGRLAGSAQTRSEGSETRFWVDIHASDVRAAPVFDDLLLPPEGLAGPPLPGEAVVRSAWAVTDDYTRGLLAADISLTGVSGRTDQTSGRGVVRVAGGSVIALPGLINLIEVSNLRAPVGAQLDLAEGVFYIDGTKAVFERLNASSQTVEIVGHGTMDWVSQDLDLRFRSRSIRPVPFFSAIFEQIRDELITTRVTGRPGALEFSTQTFGGTRRIINALLGEPETEQERVMSAVEDSSRAGRQRDTARENPAVMPTEPSDAGVDPWPEIPADGSRSPRPGRTGDRASDAGEERP